MLDKRKQEKQSEKAYGSFRHGKPDFEELFETYYDKIYRYVYSILLHKENAKDVVSDTFFAAYAAYDRYDPDLASAATWLSRIAHNKAMDFVKSASYRRCEPLPESGELEAEAPGDFTGQLTDSDALLWLYKHLTIAEREFLDLRYVMELKDAQVGAIYGISAKAVSMRYQRLLVRCRNLLEQE